MKIIRKIFELAIMVRFIYLNSYYVSQYKSYVNTIDPTILIIQFENEHFLENLKLTSR